MSLVILVKKIIKNFIGALEISSDKTKYLPYVFLLLIFLIRIPVALLPSGTNWFDEVVVTSISKLDLRSFLEIIRYEPHPPGFYLFLKIFLFNDIIQYRLLGLFVGFFLTYLSLNYADKKGLLKNQGLFFGILLFLSSYTYLLITNAAKQDTISLPLLMLHFFVSVNITKSHRGGAKGFDYMLLVLVSTILLFTGYIAYAFSIINLLVCIFKSKDKRIIFYLLAVQSVAILITYRYFASYQIGHLMNRSGLSEGHIRLFLTSLSMHLLGISFNLIIGKLLSLIFLFELKENFLKTPGNTSLLF